MSTKEETMRITEQSILGDKNKVPTVIRNYIDDQIKDEVSHNMHHCVISMEDIYNECINKHITEYMIKNESTYGPGRVILTSYKFINEHSLFDLLDYIISSYNIEYDILYDNIFLSWNEI